jgi:hypothetical protein
MHNPAPEGQKYVENLQPGDMFYWEGEVVKAGAIGVGRNVIGIDIIDVMDRHQRVQYTEQFVKGCRVDVAVQDDLPEGNCCDGFMHEQCEDPYCAGCEECGCHHTGLTDGRGCDGLNKPAPEDLMGIGAEMRDDQDDPEGLLNEEDGLEVWETVSDDRPDDED